MTDETLSCLTGLRVGSSRGKFAPNKPCLLLAIICEIQSGHITSPVVVINDRLIARYFDLYEAVTGERQSANPHLPLWHLRNDWGTVGPLWTPVFNKSISAIAPHLGQPKSLKTLKTLFTQAELDKPLFNALKNKQSALDACALLIARYLSDRPEHQYVLNHFLNKSLDSSEYEKHPEALVGEVREERQQQARSAAFRALVLNAYDFRCAATRLRFITPDYRYLVEAAHLIPFAESQDDRPTNGLALTPNLHWAMDNHLISPGPDHKWHVSPAVDNLVADNRWLWELDEMPLVLPKSSLWKPNPEALTWRMDNLQK